MVYTFLDSDTFHLNWVWCVDKAALNTCAKHLYILRMSLRRSWSLDSHTLFFKCLSWVKECCVQWCFLDRFTLERCSWLSCFWEYRTQTCILFFFLRTFPDTKTLFSNRSTLDTYALDLHWLAWLSQWGALCTYILFYHFGPNRVNEVCVWYTHALSFNWILLRDYTAQILARHLNWSINSLYWTSWRLATVSWSHLATNCASTFWRKRTLRT